ncbi:MAG: PH domain-containing protein [Nanoarchaeota archaeon]|nr:PH domain-containing protein [Nanoarchaeota archaeon]
MGNSKEIPTFHMSRIGYLGKYILFLIVFLVPIILFITNYTLPIIFQYSEIIYPVLILIGLLGLVMLEIRMRSTKIRLEDSIILNSGIFSKETTRINYKSITDVNIRQSFLQRIFGNGNIEIGVPGAQQTITQHFTGKGDINLGDIKGHHAIVLRNFQKVRKMEKIILERMRDYPQPEK